MAFKGHPTIGGMGAHVGKPTGATNLVTNSLISPTLTGWASYSGTGGASIAADATHVVAGNSGALITAIGTGGEFHGRALTFGTLTDTVQYSMSARVWPAAGTSWALFIERGGAINHGKFFNLATGALGATVGSINSASATPIGGGGYLVVVTFTRTSTAAGAIGFEPAPADNVRVYVPAGTPEAVYANAVQCELGPVATAFIPTSGTTATRSPLLAVAS